MFFPENNQGLSLDNIQNKKARDHIFETDSKVCTEFVTGKFIHMLHAGT